MTLRAAWLLILVYWTLALVWAISTIAPVEPVILERRVVVGCYET